MYCIWITHLGPFNCIDILKVKLSFGLKIITILITKLIAAMSTVHLSFYWSNIFSVICVVALSIIQHCSPPPHPCPLLSSYRLICLYIQKNDHRHDGAFRQLLSETNAAQGVGALMEAGAIGLWLLGRRLAAESRWKGSSSRSQTNAHIYTLCLTPHAAKL